MEVKNTKSSTWVKKIEANFPSFLALFAALRAYNPPIPYKVHFWNYCVCTTISSVRLYSYSVPNGKLASKLTILYFLNAILPKFWHFFHFSELLRPIYAEQTTAFVLFCLHDNCFSPVMELWSVTNRQFASKLTILCFWPTLCPFCPNMEIRPQTSRFLREKIENSYIFRIVWSIQFQRALNHLPIIILAQNMPIFVFQAQNAQIWKFSPRPPDFLNKLKIYKFSESSHQYDSNEPSTTFQNSS